MAEYIKREDVLAIIKKSIFDLEYSGENDELQEEIKTIPAADVVEVVRCADCKWFQCNMRQDGYLPHNVSEYECRHWCGPCDPTDYCSYGEPPKEES